jgi:hypothetical protein
VLPRTGYASVDPKNPPQLWCPESTEPLPPTNSAPKAALPAETGATEAALLSTDALEQRVRYATKSMGSRWQESSSDLVRQLRPQRAVLERIAHPESRLPRDP